jgi:positive regulator of sigma E activity
MLAYWYNAPRHIKLIFIIVVCAAIYAANQVQPLSPTYTVLSLVLGFGLHFGQYLQTKIPEHSSYKLKLQFLLRIYPLIIVAIIMWLLPSTQLIATIQALGFVLVGFFLVSIYQNRAKRF